MSIKKHVIRHFKNTGFSFILMTLLSACGGGGGSDSVAVDDKPDVPKVQALTGSGVKGPLANADVTVYAFDASKSGFKGAVIDTATTDNSAAIINLALPLPLTPPYIMEFTSVAGVTTDITTGQFPIISTLRTVITQALLDTGKSVYATPLTTMATDIAIQNADSNAAPYTGNNDGSTSSAELVNALPVAAAQLASTLGFGTNIDFFNTPPLIDASTITVADQTAVAQYRTAIEALTAVVFELSQNSATPAVSADVMMDELTADLMDGLIDGTANGSASAVIDSAVLTALSTAKPATLPIPGSDDGTGQPLTVDDVETLLVSEKATTGSTTDTSALSSIVFTPQPPQLDPDTDNDTVADIIDNCPLDANPNQADSNNNGIGDVCDSSSVAVDISGVWVVTSTVTSDTPSGCAGGVGDVEVTAMTIAQSGSALTVKTVSGATLTGTIDTVTGNFNLPTGSLSGKKADLTNLANAATLLNWQDNFIVSGSTVSSTSLSGNISTTETTNGATDCTYSQSFTANFKYKPSGSENFNGVYASESFQEQESLGSFGSSQDALFQPDVVEMAFTATDLTLYFPFINYPGLTFTVENNTFDPATGFFNYKASLKVRSDTDGDSTTIEQSEVSGFVFNGIFLNDPAIDSGSNGSPLILGSSYSYQLEYKGDVDSGGTVNFAKNKTEISYSKRLDTLTRTRTKLVQNADLSTETRIIMGLNNPPLKVSDNNSKLFIQVLDGVTTLCSEPFIDDGVTKGRYSVLEKLPFTSSDFLSTKFRGSTYTRIRCNTSDASGNDRVVDGNDYTVRVLDTGADGAVGTTDDVVVYSTTETASVVPSADRYTQAFDVTGIVVDGVSASAQAGSSEVLLPGYYNVNRSTVMNISWTAHPEGADSYQLLVEPLDAIDDFDVLYNRGTNSISNVNVGMTGSKARTLRLMARKDVANGARALAESRKLLILNGASGAFNLDLGNTINPAYKNMQIIFQGTGSMNTCTVNNNSNVSCNAASSSIDFNNDVVSLNMTDVTGNLVGTGNTFTLELNFRGRGSANAVVTSPDGITGVPVSATGATTSAVLVQ